jgi:hypothetical protein
VVDAQAGFSERFWIGASSDSSMGFLRAIGDERLVQVIREEVVHHRPPVVRDRDAVHRDMEPQPGLAEFVGRNVELPRAWRVESLPIRIGRRPIVRVSRVLTDGTTTEPAPIAITRQARKPFMALSPRPARTRLRFSLLCIRVHPVASLF